MANMALQPSPSTSEADLCAICLERPSGVRLRPCGHDHFCNTCVNRLFSCPLCRSPLLLDTDGHPQLSSVVPTSPQITEDQRAVVASRSLVTKQEARIIAISCFSVWLFIFVVGIIEHMHDLRQSCQAGDPELGAGKPAWLSVANSDKACKQCSMKNRIDCDLCHTGYYNLGMQCFKHLENMPPLRTGAALGGTTYFALIVMTQVAGLTSEFILIRRLMKRKLMPRKELIVLVIAISLEIVRISMVDIFIMNDYFGGRAYRIFRVPTSCSGHQSQWQGSDDRIYCDDVAPHTDATEYYVASSQVAWSSDKMVCSTFSTNSALLAFDEIGHAGISGHTRFKTMGWIIGGEFALYYFFATFINEVADNMFVVPTTTSSGHLCKIFSVALELFQLGALCPAAIFNHKDCLHYTDPLGANLKIVSTIVITFGYFIWGFIFLSLPLALAAVVMLGGVLLVVVALAGLAPVLRLMGRQIPRCSSMLSEAAEGLERLRMRATDTLERWQKLATKSVWHAVSATMVLAFLPMLCAGIFLGTLVVIGQGSKEGAMQVLTAIVLLSDVLFKVGATAATEIGDYLLHHRVRRVLAQGRQRQVHGTIIGCGPSETDRATNVCPEK